MKYGSWFYPPMSGHVHVALQECVCTRAPCPWYCLQALEQSPSQVETHQPLTADSVKIMP